MTGAKWNHRYWFLWDQFWKYIKEKKYRYRVNKVENIKINIIAPDEENGWIIYKMAKSTFDALKEKGIDVTLSGRYSPESSINHYFYPGNIGYSKMTRVDANTTFMITHVDTTLKLDQIKELTQKGAIGICMSRETRDMLIASGVKRNRICYINPAQDGQIIMPKIVLGFTNMVHYDHRKRDEMIIDVCREINPEIFRFEIMGSGNR